MSQTISIDAGVLPVQWRGLRQANTIVPITVYGSIFCAHTFRIRRELHSQGVIHHYVDLILYRDTRRHLAHVKGPFSTPVVRIEQEWLQTPTLEELQTALERHGLKQQI